MMKKSLILISFLSGCASNPQCHHWSWAEKMELKQADKALSETNPLHGLVKDYEAICDD